MSEWTTSCSAINAVSCE